MAFADYGVLAGVLTAHERDRPDDQGHWYHVKLSLTAPAGTYRGAVDVDSHQSTTGVQWKTLTIPFDALPGVAGLPGGFHRVLRSLSGGAVDLHRHPAFAHPWSTGSHLEASVALESVLMIGARTLVFGEPFDEGLGVHNIHQNQGDPRGSQWWSENGTWQDGAVLTAHPDGTFQAFVSKFTSQILPTDDAGHPLAAAFPSP
ncbi:uncharacterized protein DUF2278 [Actinocorallia herbida]|uniref:Uncharacterized protein DUF2278 n=1 Tax=Actinocorallia herbida TaxID=58109 RepID=A0A3N1CX31_9ACTN|nr:DUF2278 family protein [Actinocorallia herbida]ROO85841.1 uncharacterized protein DUF2278 [Actinocorallia herbida]